MTVVASNTRHSLVTGANRGLGLEFVRQLLVRGDRVVATCRQPARARCATRRQMPAHARAGTRARAD